MEHKKIDFPLGKDSFSKLRDEKCYFVDKSSVISEILKEKFDVYLITRPRRFGKTLTMSMLEDFFDIRRDSKSHFEDLKIYQDADVCNEWMNQWPVVFITLKKVGGLDFNTAYGALKVLISDVVKKYTFLKSSDRVAESDKQLFEKLEYQKADDANLRNALVLLTRMMYMHFGKHCILIIDEYDVPLAKASEKGYYEEMLDVIKALFDVLKTNEYLKFAVVTGCLRIAKESIFTGTNNFVSDTITGDRFNEYIGFTPDDVKKLLEDSGFTDHTEEVKEWYDGYRFGAVEVYCPWDVLNHISALQGNPCRAPKSYWANTSGNSILKQLLKKAGKTTKSEIEKLINGETVIKKISDQLTYNEIDKKITNIWSIMYFTGYLTAKSVKSNGQVELMIPNLEVRHIFVDDILEWFSDNISNTQQVSWNSFCQALENGDAATAETQLTKILLKGISIRDTATKHSKKENFYHGLLLGLMMTNDNWSVASNQEDGDGYSDIHVETDEVGFIIEVKYADDASLEATCEYAINQIEEKRYIDDLLEQDFEKVYEYGIACYKKSCMIVCKRVK